MGIQNLLPFLSNSTRDAQISEFENEFVAVDAYCWLHKGIYSCSVELAMKKPTTKYVTYCLRYIEMLLYFKVKPILVFDGKRLSSKEETEKKRREERINKYNKGKELIRAGKTAEGRKLLGESVDVTHEMAVNLMKECRKRNVDCIVAPYEADAQLAFFSLNNVVKCVITEDSDLLVYGCERVMFKMDTSGRGKLVEKSEIHLSLNISPDEYSEDKFRQMCILSGCDYLPSLPSIGLVNALKFVKMLDDKNIYEVLPRLPIYLNKPKITVSPEYIEGFKVAERTFKYQIVYDPFRRKEVPLRPTGNDGDLIGERLPDDKAFQLAIGNIDPISMTKMDDFDPDMLETGFELIWKSDSLPSKPRKPFFSASMTKTDTKKRFRERCDVDSVSVRLSSNDLKKHCSLKTIPNAFASVSKNKVEKTAFIFEPKVNKTEKATVKQPEESKFLRSRYFVSEKVKDENTCTVNDQRKDESKEEYLQRLYDECFTKEKEVLDKEENGYCCRKQKLMKTPLKLDNSCFSCQKCYDCCECGKTNELSTSEQLRTDLGQTKKKNLKAESNHFVLDEIYKNQDEYIKKDKTDDLKEIKEEEVTIVTESLKNSFSINVSELLISSAEESDRSEILSCSQKENNEEVIDCEKTDEKTEKASSPVFKIQKESRILSSRNKFVNSIDSTGTPTSIYFSASNSRTFQRANSVEVRRFTPVTLSTKMPPVKSHSCVGSKSKKALAKDSGVKRTLFQFGFKKERKEVSETKS